MWWISLCEFVVLLCTCSIAPSHSWVGARLGCSPVSLVLVLVANLLLVSNTLFILVETLKINVTKLIWHV